MKYIGSIFEMLYNRSGDYIRAVRRMSDSEFDELPARTPFAVGGTTTCLSASGE